MVVSCKNIFIDIILKAEYFTVDAHLLQSICFLMSLNLISSFDLANANITSLNVNVKCKNIITFLMTI